MRKIAATDLPLVAIGRPGIDGIPYVDVDNRAGAFRAARFLREKNYVAVVSSVDLKTLRRVRIVL